MDIEFLTNWKAKVVKSNGMIYFEAGNPVKGPHRMFDTELNEDSPGDLALAQHFCDAMNTYNENQLKPRHKW